MVTPDLGHPDADLFVPLKQRDAAALELAYDRYGALAYSVALRVLGDSGRAEEVVQDAFTTVWRRPESFDPERGNFRTWLLTIVRNRSIDVLRSRAGGRTREVELPAQLTDTARDADPWRSVAMSIERDEVRNALGSISDEQRVAIEMSYFSGYSHSEIAEKLDLPLGTVKGRLRLGMEKLHSYLSGRGYLYE